MIIQCNACSLEYVITADAVATAALAAAVLAVAVANTMAATEYNNQNKRNSCSPVLC
jgi:hypothetical protein